MSQFSCKLCLNYILNKFQTKLSCVKAFVLILMFFTSAECCFSFLYFYWFSSDIGMMWLCFSISRDRLYLCHNLFRGCSRDYNSLCSWCTEKLCLQYYSASWRNIWWSRIRVGWLQWQHWIWFEIRQWVYRFSRKAAARHQSKNQPSQQLCGETGEWYIVWIVSDLFCGKKLS